MIVIYHYFDFTIVIHTMPYLSMSVIFGMLTTLSEKQVLITTSGGSIFMRINDLTNVYILF